MDRETCSERSSGEQLSRVSHLDHIVIVHVQRRTWNFAKHTSQSFGRLRLLMGQSLGPGISKGVISLREEFFSCLLLLPFPRAREMMLSGS